MKDIAFLWLEELTQQGIPYEYIAREAVNYMTADDAIDFLHFVSRTTGVPVSESLNN